MPKAELPYNEEGMKVATKITPDVENVGGTMDFGGNVPTNDASQRNEQGDVGAYYAIGGEIHEPKVDYVKGVKPDQKSASQKQKDLNQKREMRTARLKEEAAKKKAKKTELKAYKKKVSESKLYEDSRAGRKQRRIDKLAKKRELKLGSKKRIQRRINRLSKLRDKPILTKVDTTPRKKDSSKKKDVVPKKQQRFGIGKQKSGMSKLKYESSEFKFDESKFKEPKPFKRRTKKEALKEFWSNPKNYENIPGKIRK